MRSARKLLFCLAIFLWSCAGIGVVWAVDFKDEHYTFTKTSDIKYGETPTDVVGTYDLHLDLYAPSGPGVPSLKPAIIMMHEGAWVSGDKGDSKEVRFCEDFAKRGYIAVSIEYALLPLLPQASPGLEDFVDEVGSNLTSIPGFDWLAGLISQDDAGNTVVAAMEAQLQAMEWLIANAGTYGIDTTRIVVSGASAGGLTSSLTAYCPDDLSAIVNPPRPAAYVNLWGGYWVDPGYMDPGEAPAVSVHGVDDDYVVVETSRYLHTLCDQNGIRNLLMENPGVAHGWGENDIWTRTYSGKTEFQVIVDSLFSVMDLDAWGRARAQEWELYR